MGDDIKTQTSLAVANTLETLAQSGTDIYFQHGNRDFLLHKRFAQQSGMHLLPTYHSIQVFDQTVLLCHGDTLCRQDVQYQRYRTFVHHPLIKQIYLSLPQSIRLNIARKLREKSKDAKRTLALDIMDVSDDYVEKTLLKHKAPIMIHGHTHRPQVHEHHQGTRYVLGDWHTDNAMVLVAQEKSFSLINALDLI